MSASEERRVFEPELIPAALAGASLATPGAILTRMRNVDADVRALDGEIEAQRARLPASFARGWAHWRDAWRRFYADNEGFAARVWPGTLTEVEAFARRLRDWRSAAARAGAELATPEASRPPRPAPGEASLPDVLPSLPGLPGLPSLPDLSPLRDLARALPNAARALPNPADLLRPARELFHQSPLSARFWDSVKPVVLAGAFTVAGLGLLWILLNLRYLHPASGALRGGEQGGGARELEQLAPLLTSRGLLR